MQKTCRSCSEPFPITEKDQEFYRSMGVQEPTLCYFCRMIRRLSHRNERHLYHRKCSKSGKQIISAFSVNKPFPVYDIDTWWTDCWDAKDFGRDFDFNRSFFEQFVELRNEVPRLALQQQQPMENSAYCNCASRNKNCYLTFSTNTCEDCYYGSWVNECRDCVDNLNIERSELCYECVGSRDCYNLRYSRDCVSCRDSMFLRDCIGCNDCFGCSSLVKQQYCLYNEHVGKERYKEFMSSFNSGNYAEVEARRAEIEQAIGVVNVKVLHGDSVENATGDYLRNCRDVHCSFECDHCEDISYSMCVRGVKSSMDYSYWGVNAEMMYECQACGFDLFMLRFCNLCWSGCSNLTYCDHCFSSRDSFGCVGLRKNSHCIFNKQYTSDEFEKLSQKIVEHMKETGEWGEFFPSETSAFAYSETLANEHLPLQKTEVLDRDWAWQDDNEEKKSGYIGPQIAIPDDISEVDEGICSKVLRCELTKRPFKIVAPELRFYQRNSIPLPRVCPDARHAKRLEQRNPRLLWRRCCHQCRAELETSYAPARPERIFCEECYRQLVFA